MTVALHYIMGLWCKKLLMGYWPQMCQHQRSQSGAVWKSESGLRGGLYVGGINISQCMASHRLEFSVILLTNDDSWF